MVGEIVRRAVEGPGPRVETFGVNKCCFLGREMIQVQILQGGNYFFGLLT